MSTDQPFAEGSATPAAPSPPPDDVPLHVTYDEGCWGLHIREKLDGPGVLDLAALRSVAAWAAEWGPGGRATLSLPAGEPMDGGLPLPERAGFVRAGDSWVLPHVESCLPTAALADELLAHWHAVVAAGGAVGFRQDSTPQEIRPTLDSQLAAVDAGRSLLVTTRDAEGDLLGFGWWVLGAPPMFSQVASLSRFQIHPGRQGRNLGLVQLAGMHRIIRDEPGVEQLELHYRSGTGVSAFYGRFGYVEIGRTPGTVRIARGDDRDSVHMMRRVDGRPLVFDGRG